MWILTILLLFYGGEAQAYQFGPYGYKAECQAAADDSLKLREVGLHVISATCERGKEV